jgi:hypothetical protein
MNGPSDSSPRIECCLKFTLVIHNLTKVFGAASLPERCGNIAPFLGKWKIAGEAHRCGFFVMRKPIFARAFSFKHSVTSEILKSSAKSFRRFSTQDLIDGETVPQFTHRPCQNALRIQNGGDAVVA